MSITDWSRQSPSLSRLRARCWPFDHLFCTGQKARRTGTPSALAAQEPILLLLFEANFLGKCASARVRNGFKSERSDQGAFMSDMPLIAARERARYG